MPLRFPSEIIVERFIPTVRATLAAELHERGLTQAEIATRLGISQAAVSKQLNGSIAVEDRFIADGRFIRSVERICDGIVSGEMDDIAVMSEILHLIETFEDRGPICEIHESIMPSLAGSGCDLCVRGRDDDRQRERSVLDSVRRAARLLESEPRLAPYIPKVGTNVGMALPNATDSTDVGAIPGRIYAMRGRVVVPAEPEFGCSQHVATMILAARSADPKIRGGLNIATIERFLDHARRKGYEPVEFDPETDDRSQRFEELFARTDGVPEIVFHRGAFGIEPVTYILGSTAEEAATMLLESVRSIDSSNTPSATSETHGSR